MSTLRTSTIKTSSNTQSTTTDSTDSSSQSSSTGQTSSDTQTSSPLTQSPSTTSKPSPPFFITNSDGVYVLTSAQALDVVGEPVTTLIQGSPARPIAVWNATQLHGAQVSDTVGKWAALSVAGGFGLFLVVVLVAEAVGFIRWKIESRSDKSTNSADDKTASIPLTTISRNSQYSQVPATSLPDPEPYDAGFTHAPTRYYQAQRRPRVGSRLSASELAS